MAEKNIFFPSNRTNWRQVAPGDSKLRKIFFIQVDTLSHIKPLKWWRFSYKVKLCHSIEVNYRICEPKHITYSLHKLDMYFRGKNSALQKYITYYLNITSIWFEKPLKKLGQKTHYQK